METDYNQAYEELNDQQKDAVNTIDGPMLVLAGPGTGKTQLLALRAANILKQNPTILPSNILCLTFTDAAAENMRSRMIKYFGQDAYKVGIYTFHSFGAQIMNSYPEYFFKWREVNVADTLTTHRILENILAKLPGDHELAGRSIDGSFYAIKQIKNFIADAKNANLSPDDLKTILKANSTSCEKLVKTIRSSWPASMVKKEAVEQLAVVVNEFAKIKPAETKVADIVPIEKIIIESLALAAQQSVELEGRAQTKPFTAWKDRWLAKDEDGQWTFKLQIHEEKLLAAVEIYEGYQNKLTQARLADFSDQINWTLSVLGKHRDLRLNIQERYQYVMVDEFQDTNRAQLQLAELITEDQAEPNLMVVCDDDQAIFRFQGADIAQIEGFSAKHPLLTPVVLTQNYRSNQNIVNSAKKISAQIELSLTTSRKLEKPLNTDVVQTGEGTKLYEFEHENQHYTWIAEEIRKLLDKKVVGHEIAVLARERSQLDALLPYLRSQNIPINYERRENVLEQPHIVLLIAMANLVNCIGKQQFEVANQLLPQILSEPMWEIEVTDIWKLARAAYKQNKLWFDVVMEQKQSKIYEIVNWLVEVGMSCSKSPLEHILDELIGVEAGSTGDEKTDEYEPNPVKKTTGGFVSPFKNYFFSEEIMSNNPTGYLTLLSHLSTMRHHLRNYQQTESKTLLISDLVEFVEAYQRAGLVMLDNAPHREDGQAVQLMTVHKSKGLEFDNVFVIGMSHRVWTKSGGVDRFSYPDNLEVIKPSDNQDDDGIRLLFVAMTRARQSLYITSFLKSEDSKQHELYAPLLALDIKALNPNVKPSAASLADQYEQRWLKVHGSVSSGDMKVLLADELNNYQLSATHLNNFTDVSRGGPIGFLTQNLLNFPSSIGAYGIYGNCMHLALRRAHEAIIEGVSLNPEAIVKIFETELLKQPLSDTDKAFFAKKGKQALAAYLKAKATSFTPEQKVEFNFKNQGVYLGEARLKGFIDLMDLNKTAKTVAITDYKTGRSYTKWELGQSTEEHERIKLHRYHQQLLFYKLLVDGSNEWGANGWTAGSAKLQFIEAASGSQVRELPLHYDKTELDRFKKLVTAIWAHIQAFELPNVEDSYPPTLKGILSFEQDLIKERD